MPKVTKPTARSNAKPLITIQGGSLSSAPIDPAKRAALEDKIYKFWSKSAEITRDIEARSAQALGSNKICR